MKTDLHLEIELNDGVTASLEGSTLVVKGPKGEVKRSFLHPKVKLSVAEGKIMLDAAKGTKREKTLISSYAAHIRNMVKGSVEPFLYTLKICSGHFPMNVTVSGQTFTVKNFLGESVPRVATLPENVKVKINGSDIEVTGCDRELVGKAASKIEQLCRITDRDRRIFQDGIYITNKAGRSML